MASASGSNEYNEDVSAPAPWPAIIGVPLRQLLRVWSRFPRAPGYFNWVIERWGERLAAHPLECSLSGGIRMRCDLGDHVQRQIYFRGAYEPIETYLFQKLLDPGMIVIDAGANIGQYSLVAALAVGHSGSVHAFEPVPGNFRKLTDQVLANHFVGIIRSNLAALWDQEGTVTVRLDVGMIGNAGAYSIGVCSDSVDEVRSLSVRLDDYVARNRVDRVDFIKMDIEGAELSALRGATEVLARWRPTMLVEINRATCNRLGYEPQEIWDYLKQFGYSMWAVGESSDTCRVLSDLRDVSRANVIFHVEPLPVGVTTGWTLRSVLRYHRRHTDPRDK